MGERREQAGPVEVFIVMDKPPAVEQGAPWMGPEAEEGEGCSSQSRRHRVTASPVAGS
jgi:hypothetical protein